MSDEKEVQETKPKATRKGKAKKARTSYEILKDCADKAKWDQHAQLYLLGTFNAMRQTGLGDLGEQADRFTEASVNYACQMGYSLDVPIDNVCAALDQEAETSADLLTELTKFLEDAAAPDEAAVQPAPEPEKPAPAPKVSTATHVYHQITKDERDRSRVYLANEKPIGEAELAATLMAFRFNFLANPGLTANIEVVNGEPVYVDSYLTDGSSVVVSNPTSESLEKTFSFDYAGCVYEVTLYFEG